MEVKAQESSDKMKLFNLLEPIKGYQIT